jgi:hypothetical protein
MQSIISSQGCQECEDALRQVYETQYTVDIILGMDNNEIRNLFNTKDVFKQPFSDIFYDVIPDDANLDAMRVFMKKATNLANEASIACSTCGTKKNCNPKLTDEQIRKMTPREIDNMRSKEPCKTSKNVSNFLLKQVTEKEKKRSAVLSSLETAQKNKRLKETLFDSAVSKLKNIQTTSARVPANAMNKTLSHATYSSNISDKKASKEIAAATKEASAAQRKFQLATEKEAQIRNNSNQIKPDYGWLCSIL